MEQCLTIFPYSGNIIKMARCSNAPNSLMAKRMRYHVPHCGVKYDARTYSMPMAMPWHADVIAGKRGSR